MNTNHSRAVFRTRASENDLTIPTKLLTKNCRSNIVNRTPYRENDMASHKQSNNYDIQFDKVPPDIGLRKNASIADICIVNPDSSAYYGCGAVPLPIVKNTTSQRDPEFCFLNDKSMQMLSMISTHLVENTYFAEKHHMEKEIIRKNLVNNVNENRDSVDHNDEDCLFLLEL
jgi:hypothetical protein